MTFTTVFIATILGTLFGIIFHHLSFDELTKNYNNKTYSRLDTMDIVALSFWTLIGSLCGFGVSWIVTYLETVFGLIAISLPVTSGIMIGTYALRNQLLSGAATLFLNAKELLSKRKPLTLTQLEEIINEMKQIEEKAI